MKHFLSANQETAQVFDPRDMRAIEEDWRIVWEDIARCIFAQAAIVDRALLGKSKSTD